ncbi:AAA ATPase central domain protein [Pseudofrankia inefficax]|uniref:AAA ATPase central domain protein n=1 Tax=Pseudofrankia inefficax (strain DSM 45817 / CECT 9037 / DDB 130130 / EuI1c) TaxID=298654 RepID=E3JBW6_PSEI1|nr:tetratricopeptide repeat protein [Pseudofrankia inefficax]ADP82276.1 AAA ATPase central domain protein [Pseudofrankia inefficax]
MAITPGGEGGAGPLVDSLRRAVAAMPDDLPLRLHLAEQLLGQGLRDESVAECAEALRRAPDNTQARELMVRALTPTGTATPTATAAPTDTPAEGGHGAPVRPVDPAPARPVAGSAEPTRGAFDWGAAERDLGDLVPPPFVDAEPAEPAAGPPARPGLTDAWEVRGVEVTLADVGGMAQVKKRLEQAFLAPMRNPDLRRLYGKSLRGGLLLYGPPGCGKTFVARAVAGELGAKFLSVGLADVLDMWVGSSERNMHELFQLARREAPCVLFLDEVDALGQKRSQTRQSATRGTVTQLLAEMDGVDGLNEGVFVLAATNHPWDVDPALRRPGRLDRTLLVLPPDQPAREAIFRYHLAQRPVAGVDLGRLAKATDGYSGADIAHICETAVERALLDSVSTGQARLVGMADLQAAASEVRPSMGPWFDIARNVVLFADDDGTYADLRAYLKKAKRL